MSLPSSAHLEAALAAWRDVPLAFARALPIEVRRRPLAQRIDAWMRLRGAVGEAVYASGDAFFAAPADVVGALTQRLAADANVPMLAVEGAHQVHDLSLVLADVGTAAFRIAFAPFLTVRPRPTERPTSS